MILCWVQAFWQLGDWWILRLRHGDHGGKREKNQPFCRFFMFFFYMFLCWSCPRKSWSQGQTWPRLLGAGFAEPETARREPEMSKPIETWYAVVRSTFHRFHSAESSDLWLRCSEIYWPSMPLLNLSSARPVAADPPKSSGSCVRLQDLAQDRPGFHSWFGGTSELQLTHRCDIQKSTGMLVLYPRFNQQTLGFNMIHNDSIQPKKLEI